MLASYIRLKTDPDSAARLAQELQAHAARVSLGDDVPEIVPPEALLDWLSERIADSGPP